MHFALHGFSPSIDFALPHEYFIFNANSYPKNKIRKMYAAN